MDRINRRHFLTRSLGATAAAMPFVSGSGGFARPKPAAKFRVAVIGCGRMGQQYAEIYRELPETDVVAIAEWNPDRLRVVGERFQVDELHREAELLLKSVVPDIAVITTPTKFMRDAVVMCAEAGVKAVQLERPMAAKLSDADDMVEACRKHGVKFGGGGLERAKWEVEHVGRWLKEGKFGKIIGAAVRHYISPVGCQACRTSILRYYTGAEVAEVIAWCSPPQALSNEATDSEIHIDGMFRLTNGIQCPVFGTPGEAPEGGLPGVEVWSEDTLVRWNRHGGPPFIYQGRDAKGARKLIDPKYPRSPYADVILEHRAFLKRIGHTGVEFDYLMAPIWSLLDALKNDTDPWVTGYDMRQALEIAIACKLSAQRGSVSVKLPLEDRSHVFLPKPYRWVGGDVSGRPQSVKEAAGKKDC